MPKLRSSLACIKHLRSGSRWEILSESCGWMRLKIIFSSLISLFFLFHHLQVQWWFLTWTFFFTKSYLEYCPIVSIYAKTFSSFKRSLEARKIRTRKKVFLLSSTVSSVNQLDTCQKRKDMKGVENFIA